MIIKDIYNTIYSYSYLLINIVVVFLKMVDWSLYLYECVSILAKARASHWDLVGFPLRLDLGTSCVCQSASPSILAPMWDQKIVRAFHLQSKIIEERQNKKIGRMACPACGGVLSRILQPSRASQQRVLEKPLVCENTGLWILVMWSFFAFFSKLFVDEMDW